MKRMKVTVYLRVSKTFTFGHLVDHLGKLSENVKPGLHVRLGRLRQVQTKKKKRGK